LPIIRSHIYSQPNNQLSCLKIAFVDHPFWTEIY
jgi:hypothetical protein